ncbi:hypothetical protein GUJ93_ZPchr0013g37079 [Zizania palustris]|uniref:Uncharacterized protein n=1 Tax=Zizania palustris TaxID=103762 RepID=A0A8J5WZZ4_ZIZPA|nr:hypothetical protein GUJ93_ZPchr0013g37079 [Zizania palustris]
MMRQSTAEPGLLLEMRDLKRSPGLEMGRQRHTAVRCAAAHTRTKVTRTTDDRLRDDSRRHNTTTNLREAI